MLRILLTGANGFVGQLLTARLLQEGLPLNLAMRTAARSDYNDMSRCFAVGDVGSQTDWRSALEGCRVVIHLAAQVPARGATDRAFNETNNLGTARLVEQARDSGITLFILMSSAFAVTDNASDAVVSDATHPNPSTPYGRSKLASEGHLTKFEGPKRKAIALRPPMVYGANVKGNWARLQRLASTGMPLPFGAVENNRTLVAVENLVDAVTRLVILPEENLKSGAFMVSDETSVSLKQVITLLRVGMRMSPRLFHINPSILNSALIGVGMRSMAKSLLGDLQVDSTLFQKTFGWAPKLHPHDGIMQCGAAFH